MSNQTRIMLVDDHAVVREGLRALLEEHIDLRVVGECCSGDAAVKMAIEARPDVVLIDLKMDGLPAASAIRTIREQLPETRVMVFTSYADDQRLKETLDAGATGFLLKDTLREELIGAVRAVARGETRLHIQQHQLDRLLEPVSPGLESMTVRERDVLALLGEGLSNKEIGERLCLAEGTVKGYVSSILAKLNLPDRTRAALYASRHISPAN